MAEKHTLKLLAAAFNYSSQTLKLTPVVIHKRNDEWVVKRIRRTKLTK